MPRTTSLRKRAMAGEMVLGSMVFEFFTPGIAQVLKLAGCEYVIYDMEHAGFTIEQLKEQCAHCRGLDIAPMVRVPRGEYHFIARALDVGATGIMVPMVESADEAREVVRWSKLHPQGERGFDGGSADNNYGAYLCATGKGAEAEPIVEAAMFEGHAPVLIVPDGAQPVAQPKTVLVAWNVAYKQGLVPFFVF